MTSTSKYASAQAPAAIDGIVIMESDPGRRLMLALAESNDHATETFVVATLLQTRIPTGKSLGPEGGLLLSSPMVFQLIGVTVKVAPAGAAARRRNPMAPATAKRILARMCNRVPKLLLGFAKKSPSDRLFWPV